MGRKKMTKDDEKPTEVRLRVDEDLLGHLAKMAGHKRTTVAAYVRSLIVKDFDEHTKESGK